MRFILISLIVLVVCWPTPASVTAQSDECTSLVEQVLSMTAQGCARLGSNEVCFGHAEAEALFNCDTVPEFASTGDTIAMESLCGMRVGGLQLPDQWGVAIMQVRPTGMDQDVRYVLFGDIDLRNAGSAFSELHVRVERETKVYSGPGSDYEVIGELPVRAEISANACNCTRLWLRTTLEDGQTGWFPAQRASVLGDTTTLPVARFNTPTYESMQAFTFSSEEHEAACAGAPPDGILIQAPAGVTDVNLYINGVEVSLNSTLFVQSHAGREMTVYVLDGSATLRSNDFTVLVPAGAQAEIPMSEANAPDGLIRVNPYSHEEVANLPLALLTEEVSPAATLENLQILGAEPCSVLSGRGEMACPLHFINPDGDKITKMEVQFVSAPEGEWTGSVHDLPTVIDGDNTSGRLAWNVSCSLNYNCFIGPVVWSITITDEAGHVSEPFEASFNCVSG